MKYVTLQRGGGGRAKSLDVGGWGFNPKRSYVEKKIVYLP